MIARKDMLLSGTRLTILACPGPAAAKKFGFREAVLVMTAMARGMAAFAPTLKDANAGSAARLSETQMQSAADILKLYAAVTDLARFQRVVTRVELKKSGMACCPWTGNISRRASARRWTRSSR